MTKSLRSPTVSPHCRSSRAGSSETSRPTGPRVPIAEAVPQQVIDALAQLARRLVGERDRHDAARVGARRDQPGDSERDDARLARTGAGHDEQWSRWVENRLDLRAVQQTLEGLTRERLGLGCGRVGGGCVVVLELGSCARHARVICHMRALLCCVDFLSDDGLSAARRRPSPRRESRPPAPRWRRSPGW